MKKLQDITDKIAYNIRGRDWYIEIGECKKRSNENAFLKVVANYLETEPTEEFVQSEIERNQNRIELCTDEMDAITAADDVKTLQFKYNDLKSEKTKCKKHLKTLLFIQDKPKAK